MKRRLKILRIISSLDPKFGGPPAGILDSSEQLFKEGFQVDIATCDKKKIKNTKFKNIRIINFSSYIAGNYKFSLHFFFWLIKNKHNYDYFIIHGLWQFATLAARLVLKNKYLVFVHGQLDPFFKINLLKRIKKKIYWFLIEKKNLLNSKSLLLTSIGEKESLKKTYVNTNRIKKNIIKYGIFKKKINKQNALKKFYTKFPSLKHKNFYLFLGRFHEKKGCDIIINSVKKLNNDFKNKILFAGPIIGSSYESYIKNLVNKYNLQKKIFFSDALYGDLKWGSILASKGMLLASHGENFGISIVESLSLGKPVVTTHKVNIARDILKYKAGLVSLNTVNSFSRKLNKFNKLNKKELIKISNNALKCFKDNFDLSSTKNSLGTLLKKIQRKKIDK
tara:strand:- start:278 stop:1453 length:1176 start_codon:yes stop_codon:yes gene_type:complete